MALPALIHIDLLLNENVITLYTEGGSYTFPKGSNPVIARIDNDPDGKFTTLTTAAGGKYVWPIRQATP